MRPHMEAELDISLPPGPLDSQTFGRLINHLVGTGGWITPTSYGEGEPDEVALRPGDDVAAVLGATYQKRGDVVFGEGRSGYVLVKPNRRNLTYWGGVHVGSISGGFFSRMAARPDVRTLMTLVGSPLAVLATRDAHEAFSKRLVPSKYGQVEKGSVDGYHRGLEHPHWRMWFGREWTDFLGGQAVLAKAPAVESRADGDGWFVQIHDRIEDWDKPAGIEAARRFAAAVGKRVFYDPQHPERSLEAPDFSHLMAEAKSKYPNLRAIVEPQGAE